LHRYNAVKTYHSGNGDVILSAPMHMAAAAEAGKHMKLHVKNKTFCGFCVPAACCSKQVLFIPASVYVSV